MIEDFRISVPPEELEDSALGDYFNLSNKIKGEFLLIQHEDSNFFFICSPDCNIEALCRTFDWYIVSKDRFNDHLDIGIGLAGKDRIDGEIYRVKDETTLQLWRDIIHFTFIGDFIRKFFPYTNHFKGKLRLDGALCFYIHDYYPVSRSKNLTTEQKKVSNLVFRFKEGQSGPLVAKLFSLAISRMPYFSEISDPVLIPVPASTRERHQQRFASLCSQLSRRLKITDGFRAVWIAEDRPQLKGTTGEYRLSHAKFKEEYISGRNIFLVDDILTTGETFVQTKQKLEKMGAESVTGLFLGKTI